jgi:GT2 family glycosyltransferase
MLSKGDNGQRKTMTQRAINSIYSSESTVIPHIYVVETIEGVTYKNCEMIHPKEPFNYNKFTKYGLEAVKGRSHYVLFVNNDIFMTKGALVPLINNLLQFDSVSPANPLLSQHKHLQRYEYLEGFSIWSPAYFCGWGFMMKWETILQLGVDNMFPNEIEGWYSDNYLCDVMQKNGMRHALIPKSKMEHFGSITIKSLDKESHDKITVGQEAAYKKLKEKL